MILRDLAQGRAIHLPVALVAAHPDDETLGAGARMACLRNLTLIHLSDGAPRTSHTDDDVRRDVAYLRAQELNAALATLQVTPRSRIACGWRDQELVRHLPELVARLRCELEHVAAVLTHAYEHGHPDHDAAAFAVHAACAQLAAAGKPVSIIEFPSYHLGRGGACFGRFWRDPRCREWTAVLDARERERKLRALACFESQREMLRNFPVDAERFRRAPAYDFTHPAPPPGAWYDARDWPIDSRAWLKLARRSLRRIRRAA